MILARHAEALFWSGRHLERAETTARALNVTSHNLMHLPRARAEIEWEALLDAMGLADRYRKLGTSPTSEAVTHYLFADADNPGSVVSLVSQLRENIRSVRDRVPVELWEEVNRLHLGLARPQTLSALQGEPFELFASVRRGCQAISGVIAESMARADGFTFLVVGRMLERAITTLRFVRHTWIRSETDFDAASLLRMMSALQAYRRRVGYESDHLTLTMFLLRAEDVPRSVYSCLSRAEDRLMRVTAEAPGLQPSRRLCGRLRSRLEFDDLESGLATDPISYLAGIERELFQLSEVIAVQSFHHAQTPALRAQFVRPQASER